MTLVSVIIEEAFREGNFVGELNNPTPVQAREAIRSLNSMIAGMFGGDVGERLSDWPLGNYGRAQTDPTYPPVDFLRRPQINRRLIATNDTALTVYLTGAPQDGTRMGIVDPFGRLAAYPVTLDGNGRPIEGGSTLVLDTDGLNREWFYRADLGAWLRMSDLVVADEMPFPAFFDDMFSTLLAVKLAPRFNKEISATSVVDMRKKQNEFLARYVQSARLEVDDSISWPFMSTQGWDTQRGFSSQRAFNRGTYYGG